MLSFGHMAVIFLVVLVVLGPEKLPQVARIMGKVMGDFRRITTDFRTQIEEEMREVERQTRIKEQAAAAAAAAAAAPAAAATAATSAPKPEAASVPGTVPSAVPTSASQEGPGTPYEVAKEEADQAATVLSREDPAGPVEPPPAEVVPPDPKNPDDERYHST
jgi:sec-independent protein translocase protein TatB